jgi:hypothetical protein
MTVPTKQLYMRRNEISTRLALANAKRFRHIEKKFIEEDERKKADLKKQQELYSPQKN